MLQHKRIYSVEDPHFAEFWKIYAESFPKNERRDIEHQIAAFRSEKYRLDLFCDDNGVVGLLGCWEFDDYVYIEHFAVENSRRNCGYGAQIISWLKLSTDKVIILEIDMPEDEISIRRLGFYKRQGLVETPHEHYLHIYRDGEDINVRLEVLSFPLAIDTQMYERFNSDMKNVVMIK